MTEPAGRGPRPASLLHRVLAWGESLLTGVVDVRPNETAAMWMSFVFFFFILSSYFILRPIRDAVAVTTGVTRLPWLFAGTLIVMLIANPLFSALVVRFPVRRFVPITYQFFAANLVVFFLVMRTTASAQSLGPSWIGIVFYFWASVYNLFMTSIFWCLMADTYRSEQAKRLFGFIGVGGTLGSIIGSATTASLANTIGAVNVLLVSALLIELAIFTVVKFPLTSHGTPTPKIGKRARFGGEDEVIGGSIWAGFSAVVKSPYLLGICAFMVLYTVGSTFLYFEQADIVGRYYATATARTAILA